MTIEPEQQPPYSLGRLPDPHDPRDHRFAISQATPIQVRLPAFVDLRRSKKAMPPVFDQGRASSCVAQATVAALYYVDHHHPTAANRAIAQRSRLELYYLARASQGYGGEDAGCCIRDAFKAASQQGIGDEQFWPYDLAKVTESPALAADLIASRQQLTEYQRVEQSEQAVCAALALGLPVVVGLEVYQSFWSPDPTTGLIPTPKADSASVIGGHAVLLAGYSRRKRVFIMRNSWGAEWGQKGYAFIGFDYVLNPDLASDFWICLKY